MTESKGKRGNTNASRAKQNKEMRQEALRDQLASQNILGRIDKDLEALDGIRKSVRTGKGSDRFDKAKIEVQVIKTRLDAQFKKLSKLLPDLKSQDTSGEHMIHQVTPEDRMAAAAYRMGLNEYMDRKAAGTLPPAPELPGAATTKH